MEQPVGFFQATEMPNAGWWEALWPDPAGVLAKVGIKSGMDVIDLCSGDGWFTLQIARLARFVVAIDIDPSLLEKSLAIGCAKLTRVIASSLQGTPITSPGSGPDRLISCFSQTLSTAFPTSRVLLVRSKTP